MESEQNLNGLLAQSLEAHGLEVREEEGWLIVATGGPRLAAWVVREGDHAMGYSLQVDVYVELAPERLLIESFAGLGTDRADAIGHAMETCALTTLHPLLAAFYACPDEEQVTTEQWEIAGTLWRLSCGGYGVRGNRDRVSLALLPEVFAALEAMIRTLPLQGEVHWVRLFYANLDTERQVIEVLLDNEPWEEAQDRLALMPWPRPDNFYSARLFFVLQREA